MRRTEGSIFLVLSLLSHPRLSPHLLHHRHPDQSIPLNGAHLDREHNGLHHQRHGGEGEELIYLTVEVIPIITSGSLFNDCNLSFFALCVHFHRPDPSISCTRLMLSPNDFHSHTANQRLCPPLIEILRKSKRSARTQSLSHSFNQ